MLEVPSGGSIGGSHGPAESVDHWAHKEIHSSIETQPSSFARGESASSVYAKVAWNQSILPG